MIRFFSGVMTMWLLAGLLAPLGAEQKAAAPAAAPAQDMQAYLDELQVKLEHTARRANQPTASGSSVVGLRGTKQESLSKQLYWKGKTGSARVNPEEVKLFRTAVEEARAGQTTQAAATLKDFQQKFPKSPLLPDAEEMQRRLSAAPAPK
jgi:TolA-binding protein